MVGAEFPDEFAEVVVRRAAEEVDAASLAADGDHEGWRVGGVVEGDEGDHHAPT